MKAQNIHFKQSPNGMHSNWSGSRDNVRKIVEKEGRIARNLITWSVPVSEQQPQESHSQRGRKKNRRRNNNPKRDMLEFGKKNGKISSPTRDQSSPVNNIPCIDRETKSEAYKAHMKNVIENGFQEARRPSSAQGSKKDSLRARYWSYLFDNLQRAVDEIYKTCDNDESTVECEEVIMMLDSCRKDFTALISRIKMFKEIEKKDIKSRPQSLAWEVRKMSPGKCISPPPAVIIAGRHSPIISAQKSLHFGSLPMMQKVGTPSGGFSWADKVKGLKPSPTNSGSSHQNSETDNGGNQEVLPEENSGFIPKHEVSDCFNKTEPSFEQNKQISNNAAGGDNDNDDDGWEIVARGKHRSRGSSTSVSLKTSASQDSFETLHMKSDMNNEQKSKPLGNTDAVISTVGSAFERVEKSPSKSCGNEHSKQSLEENFVECNHDNALHKECDYKSNCVAKIDKVDEREVKNEGIKEEEHVDPNIDISDLSNKANGEKALSIELGKPENMNDLILQAEIDGLMESEDQQEDDMISRQIEEENEKALASAIEEEEHLTKELEDEALKNMDDELTEDVNSDKEANSTYEEQDTPREANELDVSGSHEENSSKIMTWEEILAQYDQAESQGFCWGDLTESEPARPPGRALEMHQKLSSPSRTRPRAESLRISEERMIKAERKRLKLLEAKCTRLRTLSENVRKVRALKNNIIQRQEMLCKEKMLKVEQKRQLMLKEKIKKAQEEEAKVNEIAFINSLEAQNKKIEVQEKHQFTKARLQDRLEERQRKREEQQAKEEAAQVRRKVLEAERQARLEEITLKRKEQESKRIKDKQEREKAREEAIRERQRDREMKVAARNEALEKAAEELQKKIELKQLESSRRHEERIELVKEKAASSSRHTTVEEAPSIIPYEREKQCTICNVEIISEVFLISHLKGRKHRESVKEINKKITDIDIEGFSMKYIKDIGESNVSRQNELEEQQKAMKKRLKKIKSRMNQRGREHEASMSDDSLSEDSPKRARLQRSLKDINKLLQTQGNNYWPANKITSLDRALTEILRHLEAKNPADQRVFCNIGGIAVLTRILLLVDLSADRKTTKPVITDKILVHACEIAVFTCVGNKDTSQYMLFSNKLPTFIDVLNYRLDAAVDESPDKETNESFFDTIKPKITDPLVKVLLQTLSTVSKMLTPDCSYKAKKGVNDMYQRISDIASYFVCCGLLDKYYRIFQCIREPLEDTSVLAAYHSTIEMLQGIVAAIVRLDNTFNTKKDDSIGLLQFFKNTHLLGLLSLVYALLHNNGTVRVSVSPLPLSDVTISILTGVFRLINLIALVDLNVLQEILGAEGNCLQFKSVANFLLRYSSSQSCDELLSEIVISIGYFTVLNKDNQIFIQTGRAPTILQQLCVLPFSYFSDPKLRAILLPTLISCCFDSQENKVSMEQEISSTLLVSFIEDAMKSGSLGDTPSKNAQLLSEHPGCRSSFRFRFPRDKFEQAAAFFRKPKDENAEP